ncbi:hypothetical protein LZ30DRAFT_66264 [Colletotrichum cereale]|nr:hypothetical protein LZ30DRAFT_66264 [Colletotrichum cereale]
MVTMQEIEPGPHGCSAVVRTQHFPPPPGSPGVSMTAVMKVVVKLKIGRQPYDTSLYGETKAICAISGGSGDDCI